MLLTHYLYRMQGLMSNLATAVDGREGQGFTCLFRDEEQRIYLLMCKLSFRP